ncbi:hypothetical protein SOVF_025560 isoform A [Spinacia oleracea]|nr:hypothetical protein SOVF_025560 isoform A [Spinacia oleracea]
MGSTGLQWCFFGSAAAPVCSILFCSSNFQTLLQWKEKRNCVFLCRICLLFLYSFGVAYYLMEMLLQNQDKEIWILVHAAGGCCYSLLFDTGIMAKCATDCTRRLHTTTKQTTKVQSCNNHSKRTRST